MEDVGSPPNFSEYIEGLIDPAIILMWSLKHYLRVVSETIFRGDILAPIFKSRQVRDEAFGRFWVEFSAPRDQQSAVIDDKGVPDTSSLTGSSALIPPILKELRGVVLDIGPGTGTQMPYFVEPASSSAKNVSAIYGAEPCLGLHKELRQRIAAYGLESKYHVLPVGAEKKQLVDALRREGVQLDDPDAEFASEKGEGIFDTIVCIRVLCSVPKPKETISELYSMLRPGGQMLIVEHVINPFSFLGGKGGSFIARCLQTVYMCLGWRLLVGDCHLDRDTETYLRIAAEQDGGWESFKLERRFASSTLPYISGVLVKKS